MAIDEATLDRWNKAKVKLQGRSAFFSYLSLYLKLTEDEGNKILGKYKDINPTTKKLEHTGNSGAGVKLDGTLIYNPEFVAELTDDELQGTLCHEILHLAFIHLLRRGSRHPQLFNIACDLAINTILIDSNFQLPKNGLIPKDGKFEMWGKKLETRNKTAEELYDELPQPPKSKIRQAGAGEQGYDLPKGFDKHIESDGEGQGKGKEKKEGKGGEGKDINDVGNLSESEKAQLENEWLGRLADASVQAKQKGQLPLGVERYFDQLKKAQINWKALLRKYITALIPQDYTWARRSRKSNATGVYMPSVLKDGKIEVVISIDTSGSIGKEELTEFVSEIVGIAMMFKTQIDMRIMCHDSEVQTDYEIKAGNIDKIMKMPVKGGGGTSHEDVFDTIKKKYPKAKALISFTDGYSDLQNIDFKKYSFQKIIVINKTGDLSCVQKKHDLRECIAIKMKSE